MVKPSTSEPSCTVMKSPLCMVYEITHTHPHTHTHTHTHTQTHAHVHVHTYTHTQAYTHMHTYAHTCSPRTLMHTHTLTHTCARHHTHTCWLTFSRSGKPLLSFRAVPHAIVLKELNTSSGDSGIGCGWTYWRSEIVPYRVAELFLSTMQAK